MLHDKYSRGSPAFRLTRKALKLPKDSPRSQTATDAIVDPAVSLVVQVDTLLCANVTILDHSLWTRLSADLSSVLGPQNFLILSF